MDVSVIAKTVVSEVKSMLAAEFAPILKRLDELEAIELPSAEQTASLVVKDLLESENLDSLIDLRVTEYLVANPPPKGEKGEDGKDGVDGKDGSDGLNGQNGSNGMDGKDGEKGIDGKDGRDGEDGVGLAGAVIDRDGELVVTTTKGAAIKLGCIVGRDGVDGVGFDDMSAESDADGGVILKFTRGSQVKEYPLHFAIPVYRGYYREGRKSKEGHLLTHEGNLWIAKRANCSKPCFENKEDWELVARKGHDGKDGKNGRDLGPPPPIKLEPKNG